MNLSGTWKYTEDYSFGDSAGVLTLEHSGSILSAVLIHTETPIEGNSFKVKQEFDGSYDSMKSLVILKATSAEIIEPEEELTYELDSFEAQVINEDLIVGTSEDNQGVLGVFSFKRLS